MSHFMGLEVLNPCIVPSSSNFATENDARSASPNSSEFNRERETASKNTRSMHGLSVVVRIISYLHGLHQ
jgi:hypothetical protein